jgi:hypothetical protein
MGFLLNMALKTRPKLKLALANSSNKLSHLILFNVVDLDQYHWPAAVEIFMEKKLNPLVKSKRQGNMK